jgi:hypothetical protein
MRRDTVELVRRAVAENRQAYVLVNNHSEGNAPLTVQALRAHMGAEHLESIQVLGGKKSLLDRSECENLRPAAISSQQVYWRYP